MNLGQIIINYDGGGAERVAVTNSNFLSKRNIENYLFVIEPSFANNFTKNLILLADKQRFNFLRIILASINLRRLIKSMKITHLHAHCEPAELVLALATFNDKNIKLFITEHIDDPWKNHKILGFVVRYHLRKRKAKFIGCRNFEHLSKFDEAYDVIPNPFRQKFTDFIVDCDSEMKRIFLPQRLIKRKNIELIFQAAYELNLKIPIIILGDGNYRSYLENLAQEFQLNTEFLGFKENPWEYLKNGDLVVSASEFEGEPMSIIEAIACNAPILLSDIEGHAFAFSNEMQKFSNQRDLVTTLELIINKNLKLSQLQSDEDFRETFLRSHDPNVVVDRWITKYLSV